ncbi:leucine-rich repeat-containing protein 24 [Phlebotomus papatasi]|uniref:Uncharacterized protein n=1 Tax=Phlebotomus papatasi TaxID=29031 RepID=A0A1B0D6N8_PHLPP|nr:leucine-rich repeat-containing protein 24 [Phlebotomus papatasi]
MDIYYLAAILVVVTQCLCDDWTSSCPPKCICKWINGKKSAQCNALELTSIPTQLSTEVQVLALNENHIGNLNRDEFTSRGLVNLQRIYVKASHVRHLHRDTFRDLKILVEIDLSGNEIESLERETFAGNDRLRLLYLYGNPLRRLVANQFPPLPHLRSLDLHDCRLDYVASTAFKNVALVEFLSLKNNLLETLPADVFFHMKNLKTLTLDENPWNCDCRLRHFRNWYLQHYSHGNSLTCKRPFTFSGRIWEQVAEDQFGCAPRVELFSDGLLSEDIGSNVSYHCLVTGDPKPEIIWDFNGKILDSDSLLYSLESSGPESIGEVWDQQAWSNLTIFNVTNYDSGVYTCSARNIVGSTSRNATLFLQEVARGVIVKTPETFWYFGLILGTFGTVFTLILISVAVCVCRKAMRRRSSKKNIKGSVSFNDQEKKLLDLSITTNERQDSCEMANTPSTNKTSESVIALEPVQITIENISRNEEFPLNVGVFPPPPEFCSSVLPNPTYGNIFISVSVAPETLDNPDMYPDLLNIPNRVKGKILPMSVSSAYATLPRHSRHHHVPGTTNLGPKNDVPTIHEDDVVNYHNLESSYACVGDHCPGASCRRHHQTCLGQETSFVPTQLDDSALKCNESFLCPKYDNMGRRITASGNSTLSLPDEENLEREMFANSVKEDVLKEIPTPPLPPATTAIAGNDFVSL